MGNWQNGVTALNEDNLNALYDLRRGSPSIPSNTDLNDLTTAGTYRCDSGTVATTLINCPVSTGFKMVVDYTVGTNTFRQTIIMNNNNADIWLRNKSANSWGAWHKLQTNKIETGILEYNSNYVVGTPDIYHYARVGNVVQIAFRGVLADSIPNDTTIITLPYRSAIRSELTAFKGGRYIKGDPHFAYNVTASTYIKIATWNETSNYIHISHTYITDAD